MQKYKIWIIIALVILCLVTLLLWLSPQDEKQTSNEPDSAQPAILDREANALNVSAQNNTFFASASQQDTEINCKMQLDSSNRLIVNEQTRNCFEYFITQYGEKTIEQIQQDFKTYISQNHKEPALSQILDLWDRYMQYRQSLGEITPPAGLDQATRPRRHRSAKSSSPSEGRRRRYLPPLRSTPRQRRGSRRRRCHPGGHRRNSRYSHG